MRCRPDRLFGLIQAETVKPFVKLPSVVAVPRSTICPPLPLKFKVGTLNGRLTTYITQVALRKRQLNNH